MIAADIIIDNLKAESQKQAFSALAEAAAELCFRPADEILQALLERERLGSTAIGRGAAIPHVRIAGLKRMYGVLARLETAVDYHAPDGRGVDVVFMLLAPLEGKTTQHLKALAQVSRFLKDEDTCARVRAADGREDIAALFAEWIRKQAA